MTSLPTANVSKTAEHQRVTDELSASIEKEKQLREALEQESARCLMKDSEIMKCLEQIQERGRALSQAQAQCVFQRHWRCLPSHLLQVRSGKCDPECHARVARYNQCHAGSGPCA